MTASSTGPSRESASAIHSNGRPSMSPLDVGASSKARCRSSSDCAASPRPRPQTATRSAAPATGRARRGSSAISCPSKTSSRIASQRTASPYICAIGKRERIELGRDVQLVERPIPLAEHAEQLEQEDAQFRVGRLGANIFLQARQRGAGIAVFEASASAASERRHGYTVVPLDLRSCSAALRHAVGRPAACTRSAILLNEKLTRSSSVGLPARRPPRGRGHDASLLDCDLQIFELSTCRLSERQHRFLDHLVRYAARPSARSTPCRPS